MFLLCYWFSRFRRANRKRLSAPALVFFIGFRGISQLRSAFIIFSLLFLWFTSLFRFIPTFHVSMNASTSCKYIVMNEPTTYASINGTYWFIDIIWSFWHAYEWIMLMYLRLSFFHKKWMRSHCIQATVVWRSSNFDLLLIHDFSYIHSCSYPLLLWVGLREQQLWEDSEYLTVNGNLR